MAFFNEQDIVKTPEEEKPSFFNKEDIVPEKESLAGEPDLATTDQDVKVEIETRKTRDKLNSFPSNVPTLATNYPIDEEAESSKPIVPLPTGGAAQDPLQPAFTSPGLYDIESTLRAGTAEGEKLRLQREAAKTEFPSWVTEAPLEMAASKLIETHPDTVASRVARDIMDTKQKYVTAAASEFIASPMGKFLNLMTQLVASDTEFGKRSLAFQEASRKGMLEENKIPVFSDVLGILALGPPAIFQTPIGPFMLSVFEGAGQAMDSAAGVKGVFSPIDIMLATAMATIIKAKGFLPPSVSKRLLQGRGGVIERMAKSLVPTGLMASEMGAIVPTINSASALAEGDIEGFKDAWKNYPKDTVRLLGTFGALQILPFAKAGMAGSAETRLRKFGLGKSEANEWANNVTFNPRSVSALRVKLTERFAGIRTDAELKNVADAVVSSVRDPGYVDVIRRFHTGKESEVVPLERREPSRLIDLDLQPDIKAATVSAVGTLSEPEAQKYAGVNNKGEPLVTDVKDGVIRVSSSQGRDVRERTFGRRTTQTSFDGIRPATIDEIRNLSIDAGVEVVITAGTEPGHLQKTYSHGKGYKVDLRPNRRIDNLIKLWERLPDRKGESGEPEEGYKNPQSGAEYFREGNHWDVTVKPIQVDVPRYIYGETVDKDTLTARIELLPEVERLSATRRKLLSDAIANNDGGMETLTPKRLAEMVRAVKISRPLKSAEELSTMEEKELNQYIASDLYGGKRDVRHKDIKKLGFKVESMTELTHEQRLRLAEYGTEQLKKSPLKVDKVAESKVDKSLVNSLSEAVGAVKSLDVGPRPPGITSAEHGMIMSYLSEGKWIKRLDPDGSIRKEYVDRIAFPIPKDSQSMLWTLRRFRNEMAGRVRAEEQVRSEKGRSMMRKAFNAARNISSRRLYIDKLSRDIGKPELFEKDVERLYVEKIRRAEMGDLIENEVWKKAGVARNLAAYMANKPKLENAVKYVMGVDIRTHNPELRQARVDALEFISKDQRGSDIIKVADAYRELLHGESAVNVRLNVVNEFGRTWDNVRQAYNEIESIPKENRTSTQKEKLAGIKKRFSDRLPWYYDEKEGVGKQVTIEEMDKAWNVRKAGNDKAVRKYLGEQKWGTRDYYFMSTKGLDAETILRSRNITELPSLEEVQTKTPITPSGRILHRIGVPEFNKGSPWSAIDRHLANLSVQAYTLELSRYVVDTVNEAANKGYIEKWTARELNKAVKSGLGQMTETHPGAKAIYVVTRAWWQAFGLILPKMAWYTARNILFQGVPWGAMATQYRTADIVKAQFKFVSDVRNPDSNLRRHQDERFKDVISLRKQLFMEGFLQLPESERTKLANEYVARAQEFVAQEFSFSDNHNRRYTTQTGDIIVERYVDDFIMRKINQAQLESGLKLNLMPEGHRRYLLDLFNKGKWGEVDEAGKPVLNKKNFKKFMWETTEMKTLLANFPYQVNERSALEQNPDFRWFFGIPVYARGTGEVISETAIRPLLNVWSRYQEGGFKLKDFDFKTAQNAMGNVTAHMMSRALSGLVLATLIGEREEYINKFKRGYRRVTKTASPYGTGESILGYNLLGPGASASLKLFGAAAGVAKALYKGDGASVLAEFKRLGDQALYFTALLPTIKTFMEAMGNRQGMKNVDVIESFVRREIVGGRHKPRTRYAALMHIVFDTEPPDRDSELFKIYDKLKKQWSK